MNEDDMLDWIFLRKAVWKERYAILPHRCRISGKWIWLKKGYKGTSVYKGPGTDVIETKWHDSGEHIKWLLTKPDSISDIMNPMIRKFI